MSDLSMKISEFLGRLSGFFNVVVRARISIIGAAIFAVLFILVPQGKDIIRSLGDNFWRTFTFHSILVMWSLATWFCARFMLDQDFEGMQQGLGEESAPPPTRTRPGENLLPRLLGASGFASVACAAFIVVRGAGAVGKLTDEEAEAIAAIKYMAWTDVALAICFFLFFTYRIRILQKVRAANYSPTNYRIRYFRNFPRWLKLLCGIALFAAVVIWIVMICALQSFAPLLGTGAVVALALFFLTIIWTLIGWVGDRYSLPAISMVIVYAGLIGSCSRNHDVRMTNKYDTGKSFTVESLVQNWVQKLDADKQKGRNPTVYFVSASGGGIRAAYWTSLVLSRLQEKDPEFYRHTMVISPVSGGALGSLVFLNLMDMKCPKEQLVEKSQQILAQDFLAPAMAALFFKDLPAWFIPGVGWNDRAVALEKAWERAWPKEFEHPFERPFSVFADKEKMGEMPTLVVNGTSVGDGKRVITSNLVLDDSFNDCIYAFNYCDDMRMSTAAMMSARFTYVSPPGTLVKVGDQETHRIPHKVAVVDGGYFDNSGATTSLQVFKKLRVEAEKRGIDVVFVQIDNDFRNTGTYDSESFSSRVFPELQAPVRALLNARVARAVTAERFLENEEEKDSTQNRNNIYYFRIQFKESLAGMQAPLGWYLSTASRKAITDQLLANEADLDDILAVMKVD